MNKSNFKILKAITNNTALLWKETKGIAEKKVTDKMDNAMLNWMVELTETLQIWIDKGTEMTSGELILARTNLGCIVECWLKFFYCVFYMDYLKNPKTDKKGKTIEPNKMSFEDLKQFSIGILWKDNQDSEFIWVEKVQLMRNSIHAFNYRDIGTPREFLKDMDILFKFVENIQNYMPPLADFIQVYPCGYILNPYKIEDEDDIRF